MREADVSNPQPPVIPAFVLSVGFILLAGLTPATAADGSAPAKESGIVLHGLFSAFAGDCNFTPEHKQFSDDLVSRYSFDEIPNELRIKRAVRIPAALRPAFGKATATNKGNWTLIRVPVDGVFHGMKTKTFEFSAGHGNGISVETLVLDVPLGDLERVFGKSVRKTAARLKTQAANGEPDGLAPELERTGQRSQIVCDWSD